MADLSPITVARFWSKVDVTPGSDDCWHWKAARTGNGYGNFKVAELGWHVPAHRVAYWIANDQYPANMVVRHKCDNPTCVNPKHLVLGSQSDNMQDKVERGRQSRISRPGASNHAAKLNDEDVEKIRDLIQSGFTNTAIAGRFHVHHATISCIRLGKSWRHVHPLPSSPDIGG